MSSQSYEHLDCPIAQSLRVLGDQWTLLIIRDAMMGHSSFSEFERSLGISKRMLSRRLTDMIDDGLLEQVAAREGSRRKVYVLTQKARELGMLMSALVAWGEKWYPGERGERYRIQTRDSGQAVAPQMVVTASERAISLSDCTFVPGPGYSER